MKLVGLGAVGAIGSGPLVFGPYRARAADFDFSLIPANKNLDPSWVASLFARGVPSVYTGAALDNIGMPVGGICAGQLYLGGDGRLWYWDIFNSPTADMVGGTWGPHYAAPLNSALSPVNQGCALKIGSGGSAQYFKLDRTGFPNASFLGQYPTGTVNYSDPACPIQVTLEAFSPFIPLNTDDSSLPATIMEFTLTNPSAAAVTVEIAGWLQNAVCAFTPGVDGLLRNHATFAADHTRIIGSAEPGTASGLYDNFERPSYAPWVATGTAFGTGPVNITNVPSYQSPSTMGQCGQYLVNSHASAPGSTDAERDSATGTLTSPTFTLAYNLVYFLINGGNHPGLTCFNLCRASDNAVLKTATGANSNVYTEKVWDVSAWKGQAVYFQVVDNHTGGWGNIGVDYIRLANTAPRADIVFDDFERTAYSPWVTTGTTFGSGPVNITNVPSYQSPATMGQHGQSLVNSHASAPNSDAKTGTLTSPTFTLSRHYINFLLGGGNHSGQTCLNLLVGGQVVRTATGGNSNQLTQNAWDVRDLEGQPAQLQIVDSATGGWGNIGIDYIVFSDNPLGGWVFPVNAADNGTLSLSLLNPQAGDQASLNAPVDTLPNLFNALAANATADVTQLVSPGPKLIGALSRRLTLAPEAQATVTFVIGWHFPKTQSNNADVNNGGWTGIQNISTLQKYYATIFADAGAVAAYVAANYSRLAGQTRLWRDTWYDSTLPYWFLDRTFANTSTLATSTSHRFSNGRFWGWEGVYCCAGTCTHVWSYAQAVARIFPDIERDTRQNVDFGLAFNAATGQIANRGEFGDSEVDGQAGTILRAYREHQMAPDNSFLTTNWPKIKKAMQWFLINYDSNNDGILEGSQANTLDAAWYGKISWLSGYYVAAGAACQQMALEMGDVAFSAQIGIIWQAGASYMRDHLFYNNEYFIQLPDASGNNVGAAWGCEIDQMFGQSWAFQVGLGQILDSTKTLSALARLWKYNFAPDAGGFRLNPANLVSGGRVYAMRGEAGLVMSTFPDPAHNLPLGSVVGGYFNECMTGFEHEVASEMIWEGMLLEGLAVTRAIHDRYHPSKRNPYNEVECSDHYARAMASYGSFLAACGYEYHGPKGYLAFSPKLTPENFKAPFTAAEGWGTFTQTRSFTKQTHAVTIKHGQLKVKSLAFDVPAGAATSALSVQLSGPPVSASMSRNGNHVTVTLNAPQTVLAGETLLVEFASIVDTDSDGMPDGWETAHGLNQNSAADRNLDPDQDGAANYQEFVAGTDPQAASSVFKIVQGTPEDGGGLQVTWASVPGKSYAVDFSDVLPTVSWTSLATNISASAGATTSFADTSAGGIAKRFYRIRVEP